MDDNNNDDLRPWEQIPEDYDHNPTGWAVITTPIIEEAKRGEQFDPPLEEDELTFYDLIAQNESADDVLGDGVLAQIARELVDTMRKDVRTDWTVREDVKARLRANVKRLLRKYKYPPDRAPEAVLQVMAQMEAVAPRQITVG